MERQLTTCRLARRKCAEGRDGCSRKGTSCAAVAEREPNLPSGNEFGTLARIWQNTEMVLEDYGLRLDRSNRRSRDGAIAVLRAFLSPRGVAKARRHAIERVFRRPSRHHMHSGRMELYFLPVRNSFDN